MSEALLDVRDLRAGYRRSVVLQGVDLAVREGEVVALLGRNGMGKSSLVRCALGQQKPAAALEKVLEFGEVAVSQGVSAF